MFKTHSKQASAVAGRHQKGELLRHSCSLRADLQGSVGAVNVVCGTCVGFSVSCSSGNLVIVVPLEGGLYDGLPEAV